MKKLSAVIIDTFSDKKFASIAVKMTQNLPAVSKIFTFSDTPFTECDKVEFIQIPPLKSNNEYGHIIFEHLPEIITDDHVLIFQWDGFCLNPNKWRDDFLDYDYIGAPNGDWVGNGGFSIRSKKLLQKIKKLNINIDLTNPFDQPEDQIICAHKKSLLETNGIRFAPRAIAAQFGFEFGVKKDVLGFHGTFNFPHFFSEPDLVRNANNISSRIHNPQAMVNYLNNCALKNMFKLIGVTLKNFHMKPNLVKTYQYLSATDPNSPLLNFFNTP
jgi:hypothetical protein